MPRIAFFIVSALLTAMLLTMLVNIARADQRTLYDSRGKHIGNSVTDSAGTTTVYGADGRVVTRQSTDSQGTTTIYGVDGRRLGTATPRKH